MNNEDGLYIDQSPDLSSAGIITTYGVKLVDLKQLKKG